MATCFRPIAVSTVLVLSTAMWGPPREGAGQQASNVRPQPAPGQSRTQLPDGRWLLLGGEGRPTAASIWNPESGSVEALPALGTGRAWHTATVLPDGSVLVLGGVDAQRQVVARPERFDPSTGRFAPIDAATVSARARHTGTLLTDGRVLLLGGDVPGAGLHAEVWDLSRDVAFPVGLAPLHARRGHTARLLPDGRVWIEGGTDTAGQSVPGTEVFEPGTDIFVSAVEIPSAAPGLAGSHPVDGAVDVPSDTRVVLRFGDALDVTSIRAGSIQLEGPAGTVAASVVPAESGRLVFVTPATALAPETRFSLRATGLRSATGPSVPPASMARPMRTPRSSPTILRSTCSPLSRIR